MYIDQDELLGMIGYSAYCALMYSEDAEELTYVEQLN